MYIKEPRLHSTAVTGVLSEPTGDDPYRYQFGFGNHHVSEAIPGALPRNGTNLPQKCEYDLYAEHLNGTSFISSRDIVSNVWLYRVRPGVAHSPVAPVESPAEVESCFLPTNPNVAFTPLSRTWGPLSIPPDSVNGEAQEDGVTFVYGLKTIGGHGDPTLKEGLAVHQYAFNEDMDRQAFVNNDGDMLVVPQQGTLDIQTEMGYLRVPPGSIAVLPAGIRYSVSIARLPAEQPGHSGGRSASGRREEASTATAAVGYALEVFGTHFALPDLGVLGANALAHVRDFEYPVAHFDIDPAVSQASSSAAAAADSEEDWEVTIKLAGKMYGYTQPHTPFDVVAWHGRYAPYKYDLSRFGILTANTDQLDPTAYCVLTVPSKWPGVSMLDFCIFGEKWVVAQNTMRMPYHHRTMATELVGLVSGEYTGSVHPLVKGGLSFEQSFSPHGESYEAWKRDRDRTEQGGVKVGKGYLGFMFHISSPLGLTRWARQQHPARTTETPEFWRPLKGHLLDNIGKANMRLAGAGMELLGGSSAANDAGVNTPPLSTDGNSV